MKLKRGQIKTSKTGRTKYVVAGFSLSQIEPGAVRIFIKADRPIAGLIRDGSLARRLHRLFEEAT